ncbi:MAG: M28 family metallopeptidase [Candidatus Sericytochromatia bacterium]|nr:M28 family metallopeptidase [Candidatus Sericytochromatia bacterium]
MHQPVRPTVRAVAATLLLVTLGCSPPLTSRSAPERSAGLNRVQALRGQVEQAVDVERLRARLSVLTGLVPLAPAVVIPERGSVQGRALTRRMITEALAAQGYVVEGHRYRQHGENLLVRLPAQTPTDTWILVGAHMDSVRNAGADDNGSGAAAVLELATVLAGLPGRQVNLMLAFFDEEELGLVGSAALAKDLRRQRVKVAAVHTADMIGYDADGDRTVEIERPDGGLWDYYRMVNERHGLNVPLVRTNSGDTDHVAFRAQGFPSVGLCEEWVGGDTTPHYHRKTDTLATLDLAFLASTTRLLAAVVADQLRGVAAPRPSQALPHNRFPGRPRHLHHGSQAAHPAG